MARVDDLRKLLQEQNSHRPSSGVATDIPLVDQGFDSLDLAELLYKVEQKWRAPIPINDAAAMRTLDDVLAFLDRKLGPS